jgi:hypothetical protein
MSSEVTNLAVAMRKMHNPEKYWAFFTKEEGAFWNFVDRSREDLKTQASAPQHTVTTGETGSPDTAKISTEVLACMAQEHIVSGSPASSSTNTPRILY